ncbi:MAG: right-handed parallel beta-helix repeat-containing protein [Planctomycetota bacterium]
MAGIVLHVDDDAPNDPGPGDNTLSDPLEDGSLDHPFDAIQEGIDAAVDTDEVVVAPGTYFEIINFLGKAITLRSSDGRYTTTIDALGVGSVVTCDSGEGPDTKMEGFTITGGTGSWCCGPLGPHRISGGGMLNNGSSPTVIGCTFTGNSADRGGGMYNHMANPSVIHCTFSWNWATTGGGMANGASRPRVIRCTFSANLADNGYGTGSGGGMSNFGAGEGLGGSSPTVIGCTFGGNSAAGSGGGVYNGASSPTIINCTFNGNSADVGGAMSSFTACEHSPQGSWCLVSNPILINCVIWGNTADEIFDDANVPEAPSAATVRYCDVQGGWYGDGSNNIDADPLFADPDSGDFRLSPDSPCIDAGNNWAIADLVDTDLDGNPRFADEPAIGDSGCGIPAVVDMGAYEFQGEPTTVTFGDLTGDGVVGLDDFELLLDCWSSSGESCCLADLDVNGSVNVVDFLILLANWE